MKRRRDFNSDDNTAKNVLDLQKTYDFMLMTRLKSKITTKPHKPNRTYNQNVTFFIILLISYSIWQLSHEAKSSINSQMSI